MLWRICVQRGCKRVARRMVLVYSFHSVCWTFPFWLVILPAKGESSRHYCFRYAGCLLGLKTASNFVGSLLIEAWATQAFIRPKFLPNGHVRAKNWRATGSGPTTRWTSDRKTLPPKRLESEILTDLCKNWWVMCIKTSLGLSSIFKFLAHIL